jgi:hypothetical protein
MAYKNAFIKLACSSLILLPSFGDTITVSIQSSSLASNPNGPFTLEFQLTDGSGTSDGNNTILLSTFAFNGATLAQTSLSGGASATSSPFLLSLTDSSFFNDAQFQFLNPGAALSFQLTYTVNPDDGTPDVFTMLLLDSSLNPVPTLNPVDGISILEIDLPTTNPGAGALVQAYGVDLSNSSGVTVPAPLVGPVGAVPEPSTLLPTLLALTFLVAIHRRILRNRTRPTLTSFK